MISKPSKIACRPGRKLIKKEQGTQILINENSEIDFTG
jgi:hypothetical protein